MIHTDIFNPKNFGNKYLTVWCPDDQAEKEFVRIMTEFSFGIPCLYEGRKRHGSSLCCAIRQTNEDNCWKYVTYGSKEFYRQNSDRFHLVPFEEFLHIVSPQQIDINAFLAIIGD